MKQFIRHILLQAHLPIFLVLVGLIGYGLFHNIVKSVEFERWMVHTHEVMTQVTATQARMYEADATFLRYAVSKEERYLELFHQESTEVKTSLERLQHFTVDNIAQQETCQALLAEYTKRRNFQMSLLDKDVETLRTKALTPENNNIRKNISSLFVKAMDEEKRLLVIRETSFNNAIMSIGILAGLFAIMLCGAFGFILGEMHNQKNILSTFLSGINS